jgi:hypothetical protein
MNSTEYAQARMQARFGARPDAALWRELDGLRDLKTYLEAANGTSLRFWVAGMEAGADLHPIEIRLRERFRAHIREVAGWLPPEWRPAVLWLQQLLALPAVAHLLSGHAPLPWMSREPELQKLAAGGDLQGGAIVTPDFLRRDRRGRRVLRGAPDAGGARAAWLAEWERRWPTSADESSGGLRRIIATISAHLAHFGEGGVRDAGHMRAALERALRVLFRRSALQPEAAFSYLGLVALDLERLRAQLVLRFLWQRERTAA